MRVLRIAVGGGDRREDRRPPLRLQQRRPVEDGRGLLGVIWIVAFPALEQCEAADDQHECEDQPGGATGVSAEHGLDERQRDGGAEEDEGNLGDQPQPGGDLASQALVELVLLSVPDGSLCVIASSPTSTAAKTTPYTAT